jgi:hypothetical protein
VAVADFKVGMPAEQTASPGEDGVGPVSGKPVPGKGRRAHTPAGYPGAGAAEVGYFVQAIERWRGDLGLSSNHFADYLEISRSYWSLVRRGRRPVSMSLVRRVLRERPDLGHAVTADAIDPRR